MRVTMDVFSGRPNPSWKLTPKEAEELAARIEGQPVDGDVWQLPKLGFRNFIVEKDLTDRGEPISLPYRFRVGASATQVVVSQHGAANISAQPSRSEPKDAATDADNARWLLETAKGQVSDEILNEVLASLTAERSTPTIAEVEAEVVSEPTQATDLSLASLSCYPFLTPLRLGIWNSFNIRPYNNCYNYAANLISNTLAQPGRRSNHLYTSFDCEAIMVAAAADGCRLQCEGTDRVLALAIWPGFDFHWWRLHPDNIWAQKLGWSIATNRDNQGRVIGGALTPENCDRLPYSVFCGYFYAPLGMQVI